MIVRNEASRLARAVESVRGIADEVVITDTGSTDGTVALAERLGARVSRFEWCDDFAAARNACVAEARGKWVLWIDGDERLKPGCGPALLNELAAPGVIAYQMLREEFDAESAPAPAGEMHVVRLWRRDLPIRFEGRIHEHPVPWPSDLAAKTGRRVQVSAARLQHWGYTPERIPEKCLRAARLCEMELRDRPGQLYYLIELARSLLQVNTPQAVAAAQAPLHEATQIMLSHRDAPRAPLPLVSALIEQLLAIRHSMPVDVDTLLELAARWFPCSVPLMWASARVRSEREEWPQAEELLRRLEDVLRRGTHDRYAPFDPRLREDARFNLGVCLVRRAALDEAQAIFTELLASPRRGADARRNLDAILALRERFGA
ncbi:MAG: glycosyltransferase family 2 protein [Phycisphaeraceae bacterium]|nr:glycosyltransferase family 2 protein [Phycisphaeraceae bacterium]